MDRGLFVSSIKNLSGIIRPETQNHGSEKTAPQSWPECPASLSLPIVYVSDNGTQTDKITCDHKAEINDRVRYELIEQLLKFNEETFDQFMQNLIREHEKRIKYNNQLRH